MEQNVPRRGDGFDIDGAVPVQGSSVGQTSSVISGQAIKGLSLAQIMQALSVDEGQAKIIKGAIGGIPAGALSGLSIATLGDYIGEEWAGALGGALGGLLGGLVAKKTRQNNISRRRRY